jgi:hypothetical protein
VRPASARTLLTSRGDARLDEVRPVDDEQRAGGRRLARRRRPGVGNVAGLPGAEHPARPLEDVVGVDVSGGGEDGVVGQKHPLVQLPRGVGVEARDRRRLARQRNSVAVPVEEGAGGVPVRQGRGVVLGLLQAREGFGARLFRLFGIEARPQRDVGENLHELVEIAAQPGHLHRHRIPAAGYREGGPHLVDGLRERQGVALAGAALHDLGGEAGQARLVEVDHRLSAARAERQHDSGQAAVFQDEDAQPVVELGPGEAALLHYRRFLRDRRRQLPGRTVAGAGARGDPPQAGGDGEAAGDAHQVSPPSGGATTCTTLLASSTRYFAATRCTSSTVTAWMASRRSERGRTRPKVA